MPWPEEANRPMNNAEHDEEQNSQGASVGMDPIRAANARRRLGFVAALWWIAALSGTLGLAQGTAVGWVRRTIVVVAWVLALLFTYAWLQVRLEQGK